MKTPKTQKGWRLPVGCMAGVVGLMLCLTPGAAMAQKDTIHVPVRFYDFRSDRSNPEFEQPNGIYQSDRVQQDSWYWACENNREQKKDDEGHNRVGMVDSLLDKDKKPKMGPKPYLNHGVRFWFRDWSKLNTYEEASTIVNGRGYLTPFRPIYTYNNSGGDNKNSDTNILPPDLRQGADAAGILGDRGWENEGEYRGRPNTGVGAVPYAYEDGAVTVPGLNGGAARTGTVRDGSVTIDGRSYTIANAYQNRVIDTFLVFQRDRSTNNGTYRFDVERFFPLDGKGFEGSGGSNRDWNASGATNCASNHNYSYTMELIWNFKYVANDNLSFNFRGDDDVWVFINGKLAMDIGGVHNPVTANFRLNDIARTTHKELVNGNSYEMRMFYSERHSNGSSIEITTNIISDVLTKLELEVKGDSITAGDSTHANAVVGTDAEDNKGILKDYTKGFFTWRAEDRNTIPGQVLRISERGVGGKNPLETKKDTVWVYAEKAHTTINLIGEYCDTTGGPTRASWQCVADTIPLRVVPGPATQVSIEEGIYTGTQFTGDYWKRTDVDTIRISSTATLNNNFYAVLRDKFNNWIGPAVNNNTAATSLAWSTADPTTIASALPGPSAGQGQGEARRVGDAGSTRVFADYKMPRSSNDLVNKTTLLDTSVIKIEDITYTKIRIGVKVGGEFIPTTRNGVEGKIIMTIPSDTMIWVQVERSDRPNQWVEAPVVTWSQSGFTAPVPTLPASETTASYRYNATAPQNGGRIIVAIPGHSDFVTIVAEYNDAATIRFYNRRGTPTFGDPIMTFDPASNPPGVRPYPVPNQRLTVRAGDNVPIVAAFFATNNPSASTFLPDLQGGGLPAGAAITWAVLDVAGNPITGANAATTITSAPSYSDSAVFKSTVALYDGAYYTVRATYTARAGAVPVTQNLFVSVNPGDPKKIYIEPNANGKAVSPNKAQLYDKDTIYFDSNEKVKSAYAVLRDQFENFVGFSGGPIEYYPNITPKPTGWSTNPTGVVDVERGYIAQGEGIVTKLVNDSKTVLTARDSVTWPGMSGGYLTGSVNIRVLDYTYDTLRIVKRHPNGTIEEIPSLEMTTNDDDVTLIVQGRRTDNGEWEEVTVSWRTDEGLTYALTDPPRDVSSWDLAPTRPGKGKITVSRVGQGGTITAEIDVTIKLGPPMRAELEITTPADQIMAGKFITAEVTYYNKQGKMTSWDPSWKGPGSDALIANFTDVLAGERNGFRPEVHSVRGKDDLFNLSYPGAAAYNATLYTDNGVVTVLFKIYNATDNPHQIQLKQTIYYTDNNSVSLDPKSLPFIVKAGDPKTIEIKSNKTEDDTLRLKYSDPDEIILAVAYDEWGNEVGEYPGDWRSGEPIVVNKDGVPVIVYSPKDAEANGVGQLCVTTDFGGSKCITVVITGVTTYARSLITRDTDGCGYLDRIELKFPKPIVLTQETLNNGKKPRNKIIISYRGDNSIVVDSVTANPADSSAIIWLKDVHPHSGDLQTGWRPDVTIPDSVFVDASYQEHKQITDGAAPVIASAKLYFPSNGSGNIRENWIEVKFSEDVRTSNRVAFNVDQRKFIPEELFTIYELSGQGKKLAKSRSARALAKMASDPNAERNFTELPAQLSGITTTHYVNDNTLRFYLENDKEIGPPSHYINIKTFRGTPTSHVWDVPLNEPTDNNRKVPVTFGNEPKEKAVAIPNPASPDGSRAGHEPGRINVKNDPEGLTHVKAGGGGTVLEVPIYVPQTGTMKCQLKVYDLAGNLVISGEGGKIEQGYGPGDKGAYNKLYLYWNGFNSKAMKVAPGTYRMVVYISYSGITNSQDKEKAKNKKLPPVTVGMSK